MIWLNGTFVSAQAPHIHHQNSGWTTGLGIFDSLLCIDGVPQHVQDHYERLLHDSEFVLRQSPKDFSFLLFKRVIKELLKKNNLKNGLARIRTTVIGGVQSIPLDPLTDITILMSAGLAYPPTPITAVIITDYPRIAGCPLENCKRLDYTRSYAARMDAREKGATDALLTNTNGDIACGTTSNIFIEEHEQLITPPLSDGVLAGVTRKNLIKERDIREENISIDRLLKADKVYLSNSFMGLQAIKILE